MNTMVSAKQISISVGLYGIARAAQRAISRPRRAHFHAHRALLGQFVKAGDLAFDVGANTGSRSEILLSLGASVVAFEPQADCAREITALRNRRLTVVQEAVGETAGSAILYAKKASVFASLVPNWPGSDETGSTTVQVTTLDAAILRFGVPAFCKIDVEGFEPQVLRGLSQGIRSLSFEYHCDHIANVKECLERLSAMGHYRANLTAQDDADFLLPRWVLIDELSAMFPACTGTKGWGDIFLTL